ncbi:MAG: DUF3300 domain-containing protein [Desulfobacterales bacterium]|nr:DUF3300 domain-containing protein [Desulfobacterales bacterium]MDD4391589.1 DUF3300 domain-containing protein [Desulfobacterales bacterium]
MKTTSIYHPVLGLFITFFLVFCLALPPRQGKAEETGYPEPSEKYSREELAQMLAPIALYPDALLSQILMASTYPIEVIEADRWIKKNPELKGDALDTALLDKNWDPGVKAICHFPEISALMSERISETTNLGNAFLAQEAEVMDVVQELRTKAYDQGNLTTTSRQKVLVEKETIIIEPADPRVIYVPYYDPFHAYGPWWYPAYPPYYWGPPGVSIGVGISYWPGFYFGFAFGTWSHFDWNRHHIYINVQKRPRFVRHDRWITTPGRWQHAPSHRRGVAYRDKSTARKYGQDPNRSIGFRRDTRGFLGPREVDRDRRGDDRIKIDRNRQQRKRVEQEQQIQKKTERNKQEQGRVKHDRQIQQRTGQEIQTRKRIEREPQQKSRSNVFNRIEEGRKERQSSERGRGSRQGLSDDSRGK